MSQNEDIVGAAILPQHVEAVSAGAECWHCPLYGLGRGPVPPSWPHWASPADPVDMVVVAEAPGSTEVAKGETLIGASGREIRTALRNAGVRTDRVAFTNALMCQPPDDLKKYLQQVKRQKLVSPIDACRPRLQAELSSAKYVLLMGGASLQSIGINQPVLKVRGTPLQIPNSVQQGLAIPHAAFVMRDEGRVMRPIFHADVRKAARIAAGGNTWKDPRYFVAQNAAEIENFLNVPRPFTAIDTETDGVDSWTCRLRRVGIGTAEEVLIFSPLSVRGQPMFSADETTAQTRAITAWLQRRPTTVFHNYYGFDSVVLNNHGMPVHDETVFDTLLGHQVGPTSELPHRLDFLGSIYTDAPYWKDDVKHSNVKSDEVLDKYLSYDIAVTWLSAPWVHYNLQSSQQVHIYNTDVEMSRIGRSMSSIGIHLNKQKQFEFAREYQTKSEKLTKEFKEAAGKDINPSSYPQVRKLLYHDFGLPMLDEHITDSGEPSTDEDTLLDLLGLGVDKRAEKVIHALLGVREAEKILGTYTGRIENGQIIGGPPTHIDGRMRTTWRPGRVTGRWSSSDPVNMQNVVKRLRAMYTPNPGNVFVAADYSALELRILALLAGDEILIKAFEAFDQGKGPDVHIVNACTVFRCKPEAVTDEVRNFIKRFVYGLSYGAGPPKIYQTLSLLRDDNLKPLFPHITLAEVERVFNLWWDAHPAIVDWQKKLVINWRSHGYIATALHGRKRFFTGGENHEEQKNFPIQGMAADLQNDAVKALVSAYPFDYGKKTGVIAQVHDQLVVECPEGDAERVAKILSWAMQKRIGPMLFPAQTKIGKDWKTVS